MSNTFYRKHMTFNEAVANVEEYTAVNGLHITDAELGEPGTNHYEWSGGTFSEVMAMAKGDGYSTSVPKVDELVRNIDTDLGEALTPNFDWQYDVTGSDIDMGRFVGGEPENMISVIPMKVMRTGRIISLYIPGNFAANIDPELLIARGAACVALADAFAKVQHPLEIWSTLINDSGRNRSALLVNIQEATQPLDMGRIMFALAHPGFSRQLGFNLKEWAGAQSDFKLKSGRFMASDMGWERDGSMGGGDRRVLAEDIVGDAEHSIILPELTSREARNFANPVWVEKWIMGQLERVRA